MVKWTKEQEKAIYTSGTDVLVAAAAGSGKTAVLVERIIQKLLAKENPVDIDSLLVVTFTNAAAQEMRNRVGLALEEALAITPSSNHLKKQISLLQRASISTLHSFCMDVVRQHAYLLDIDPGFRIANEMEVDLIKQDVINELFETWYSREDEELASFFSVIDRFSTDRSDEMVEDLILSLYTFSIQHPYPELWLDQLADVYQIPDDFVEDDLVWLNIIKEDVKNQLQAIEDELSRAEAIARESDGPYQYVDTVESDRLMINEAKTFMNGWDKLQTYMKDCKLATLSRKKMECNEDKKEQFKTIRDRYRKRFNDLKETWFNRKLEHQINDMRQLYPVVKQLTELVKQFKLSYTEQKIEKGIVDFSDLEHYCLALLRDNSSTTDRIIPSEVALGFKKQFSEILVDEYQDTNLVQETIINLVSDQVGTGNTFMVGDVKQSIYGFRHAEPSLFIKKYKQFSDLEHAGQRIDLANNFRSREQVLIGANYIFRQLLDETLGDINYDQDAELIYSNKMYDTLTLKEPHPELIIIDRQAQDDKVINNGEEDYQDLEKAQLEARVYAEKIKRWIGQGTKEPLQVADKSGQGQRDLQYRDIVILLRSMSWAPTIMDELKKQGIPVYAELSTGYFEAIEIRIMLSFLKIVDNPRQDIPLAAVLRSPIVNLDEEELARIRLADRSGAYYDALIKFKQHTRDETAEKITLFLEKLATFRSVARQGALSELIWQIYRETGYYDFVGGMPGGRQRQANLRALYDRARGYETTSFRGLFRFLRFIERMEERGDDLGAARALSEQEDVVRIMTIHKSKGLEFPVVILGGMDRQFNLMDLNRRYLLDKDFGFATRYIDPIKRITYPTLHFNALKLVKLKEQLAEEIRVLYVALTRAREKIIMVGNVASFKKKQEKWQHILEHQDWVLPSQYRIEARSYLDWVAPALMRHEKNQALRGEEAVADGVLTDIHLDPSEWKIEIIHGSELANITEADLPTDQAYKDHIINWQTLQLEDNHLAKKVDQRLSYVYPNLEASHARAKQTVTEIKRQREIKDDYSSDQLIRSFQAPIIKRPTFMQKEKVLSAADKGTAMHTIMQHLPMNKVLTTDEIKGFVDELVLRELLTNEEANVIDVTAIAHFYHTSLAKYLMNVENIHREVPFSMTLPASEIYSSWSTEREERVLVQGVIDCLIPQEDGWIILDYKTDAIEENVTEIVKNKLIERYAVQMELYAQAVESIWKQPIKKTYLYFFSKQLLIEVPQK